MYCWYLGSKHWICTCSYCPGNVQIMDSIDLFCSLNEHTMLQIAKIYSPPHPVDTLTIHTSSVQQQQGICDCGIFAIATAIEVCNGNNPERVQFNQKLMRGHLIKCLSQRKLTGFPKITCEEECLPRPVKKKLNIKLFCHCKMPEELDNVMILCDTCDKWFHCSCESINPDNIPDKWSCSICCETY